jgi:universal stress protein A
MNIKRILCPVDFSVFNKAANEYACKLAESTGAEIVYLHSWIPNVMEQPPIYFEADKEEARLQKQVEEFIEPTSESIHASWVIEFGSPRDRIVEYASKHNIDLIVMGTHGRTGLRRIVMGSVAEAVVRRASCPVIAVKSENKVPQAA